MFQRLFLRTIITFFIMINIFFFTGCDRATKSETDKKPIKIAVNPWVGYTPLMYLNEKSDYRAQEKPLKKKNPLILTYFNVMKM